MRFGNLVIKNFLSIKEATVNLTSRGLVLIEGKNLDDSSARSNGAGKSSIADALCWCLFGKTARGVSGNDVINRKANKNCLVSVEIHDNKNDYVVVRTRKNPSNTLTVHKGELDLTKGTVAETQKVVETIIGCPYDVFCSTVYAGQENMPDLPAMTDKELKALIESVLGVERISAVYQKVLDETVEGKHRLDVATNAYSQSQATEMSVRNSLQDLVKWRENWESDQKATVEEWRKRHENAQAEYKNALRDLEAKEASAKDAVKVNDEIDAEIAKDHKLKSEISTLRDDYYSKKQSFSNAQLAVSAHKCDLAELIDQHKNANKIIGQKCPTCGKPFTADDLKERQAIIKRNAQELAEQIRKESVELQNAQKAMEDAKQLWKDAENALPDTSKILKQKEACINALSAVRMAKENVSHKRDVEQNALSELNKAEKVLMKTNPYIELVKQQEESLQKAIEQSQKANKDLEQAKHDISVLGELKTVFGSQGVRQHILDTITPILNDKTADYLNILSDGKLTAIWTTLTANKSGEVKEKFSIQVANSVGGGTFDSLSGGEKRKVRVACCLALQELVASRATKPIEIFIADEVDHALDDTGVERLIGVLNEKAKTCGTLMVISHNPLRNWIDKTITITKENGYSEIK
jgi:DNA repair exonuclease SbcCD ATPase subunit